MRYVERRLTTDFLANINNGCTDGDSKKEEFMGRDFIRHPMGIPIELDYPEVAEHQSSTTHDLSASGLCCVISHPVDTGAAVEVSISTLVPSFKARGLVVWCHPQQDHYLIGISFSDADTAYAVRMVEQICHIEDYRRQVEQKQSRQLSSEQAAMEWISNHAEQFPAL